MVLIVTQARHKCPQPVTLPPPCVTDVCIVECCISFVLDVKSSTEPFYKRLVYHQDVRSFILAVSFALQLSYAYSLGTEAF